MVDRRKEGRREQEKGTGEGKEGGKLHAQADGQKRDNKRVKATPPC